MYYDDDQYHDPPINLDIMVPLTETQKRLHAGDATELIDKINSYKEYIEFERYYIDRYNGNPLHHAIRCNNVNVATALVLKGADVNKVDYYRFTPIYYALRQDNEKIVELLLNNKVSARGTYTTVKRLTYLFEYVCQYSNLKIVKLFLSKGCTVSDCFSNERNGRPLHAAIMSKNFETMKFLINYGANVNQINALGETPLYLACMLGCIEFAEILLKSNALVNVQKMKNKKTAFYHAIKSTDPQLVKLLLENGALVDNEDVTVVGNICNPLHQVIRNNGVTVLRDLLEAGLCPNQISSEDIAESDQIEDIEGCTFLHTAVICNNIEIIELLLEYEADVCKGDIRGCTPLHIAAKAANMDAMELLLAADPKIGDPDSTINMKDFFDYTPLHLACESKSTPCIQFLIDLGANLIAQNYKGDTILHHAIIYECSIDIIQQLLSKVPINILNNDLNSPLHLAVMKKSSWIVELLVTNGAETVIENENHLIPLEVAFKHQHTDELSIIANLLQYTKDINDHYHRRAFCLALNEIDIETAPRIFDLFFKFGYILNQKDEDIHTLMYIAARNGHTYIVKKLLKLGADPNTIVNMEPVLHAATRQKHTDTIAELLKHGADPRVTNDEGKLALHITVANMDPASFKLLLHSVDDNSFPELLQFVVDRCPSFCYDFIKIIVERGADVNAYHNDQNILHCLVRSLRSQDPRVVSRIKAIRYVLKKGVHVDARTSKGSTSLHLSAGTNNPDVVKVLLDYGAYIEEKDRNGSTPLILHVKDNALTCIEVLLNYNADLHARSASGTTAIDILLSSLHYGPPPHYQHWPRKVLDMCDVHMTKLRLAGLYVHPKVSERLRRPPMVDFEKQCQDELKALKEMRLNAYVSGYDFLVRNLTDAAKFIRDDDVRKYIEREIKSDKYPLYGSFMRSQLTLVKKRSPYLGRAEKVLNEIHERSLPDICTEKITGYLDAEDLINLAECDKFISSISEEEELPVVNDQSLYSFVVDMFYQVTSTMWRSVRSFFGLFQRND